MSDLILQQSLPPIPTTYDGVSFCCLAAKDGKTTLITYKNTHLYQKPVPVRDPGFTISFTTRFKPIPPIDDYNPTYIDPNYGRYPYWDTEINNQVLLQFHYVLDDIGL